MIVPKGLKTDPEVYNSSQKVNWYPLKRESVKKIGEQRNICFPVLLLFIYFIFSWIGTYNSIYCVLISRNGNIAISYNWCDLVQSLVHGIVPIISWNAGPKLLYSPGWMYGVKLAERTTWMMAGGDLKQPSFGCSTSQPPPRREGVKLTLLHLHMSGGPTCTVAGRWSSPVSW